MLIATCDKKVLIRGDLNMERWLWQLVLTDLCLIAPIPHKKTSVILISKWDQKVIPWRKQNCLNSVLVALQVLYFIVVDSFLDNLDFLFSGLRSRGWSLLICSHSVCSQHFYLLGILVFNLPNGYLREAESALTCRQILAVAWESDALERPGCARCQKLDLFCISWGVNHESWARQIADVSIYGINLQWVGPLARSANYFFELQLF